MKCPHCGKETDIVLCGRCDDPATNIHILLRYNQRDPQKARRVTYYRCDNHPLKAAVETKVFNQ